MIKNLVMAALVATGLTAGGDIAEIVVVDTEGASGLYVGAGVGYDNYLVDKQYSGTAIVGYDYNDYIGAELRASSNFTGNDKVYSAFIKPQYPLFGGNVYALLGAEKTYDYGYEVNSYAAGVGVEYGDIRVDTVYNDVDEDYKTLVSYVYRF